jgi:hypothetical protein
VAFSQIEVREYARKVGKTERTLWRWIKQGCNPRDPKSLRESQVRNQIRETPIERARKRRRDQESHNVAFSAGPQTSCDSAGNGGNGHLPPIGKKGAAAALERLEASEERAHARLEAALASSRQPGRDRGCSRFLAQMFGNAQTTGSRGRSCPAPGGNSGSASGSARCDDRGDHRATGQILTLRMS